ncbi:MAG: VanZ family protein [Candidatus Altiarchaeota archaeon]
MNSANFLKGRRSLNVLLVVAWMAVIFMGSSIQKEDMQPQFSPVAKVGHLMEYAVLGFLAFPLAGQSKRPLLSCVIFCAAYAASDEFHQLFVPGRHGTPVDVLIDAVGAVIGSSLSWRLMG